MSAVAAEEGAREVYVLRVVGMPLNQEWCQGLQALSERWGVQCALPGEFEAGETRFTVSGLWRQAECLAQEIMDGALGKQPISVAIQSESGMFYYLRRESDPS